MRGWGLAHTIARLWFPISSPLTRMVNLLPFFSYLAGSKSVSAHQSDPDTMTNIGLEAIASSSAKKVNLNDCRTFPPPDIFPLGNPNRGEGVRTPP